MMTANPQARRSPRRDAAAKAALAERREKAIQLRTRGVKWVDIAAELGYASDSAACMDVSRALKARQKDLGLAADEYREQMLADLDELQAAVWRVMEATHLTVQNGKVVRDEAGAPVLDDAPVLQAVDRLLKITERRAKVLGIDAPTVLTGTLVNYTIDGVPPEVLT